MTEQKRRLTAAWLSKAKSDLDSAKWLLQSPRHITTRAFIIVSNVLKKQ
jgi:hypothetical protein